LTLTGNRPKIKASPKLTYEGPRVPLYEYECKKCKHRFEKIQKFSDSPMKKCPQCGGTVEQLLSAPSVQFKGSGWYVTDYARKGSGSAESGTSSEGAKSDTAKDSASSPGKPADKTDSTKTEKKTSKK
jgi:putative FmdB family regulatory protein